MSFRTASIVHTCAFAALAFSGPANAQSAGKDATAVQSPSPRYQDAVRLIDAWLDAQRAYDRVPGMSVAIVNGQELLLSKGYGSTDAAGAVPATSRSIYSICSVTKLFTAMGVMQLVENGKLNLDDDIKKHLNWFSIQESESGSGPISIRSLLTHSSGLPREADFPYWSGPDFSFPNTEQLRAKLPTQKALYRPSEHYQYSNLGMTLAGDMLVQVSGQTFESFLANTFTTPLGMTDTRPFMPMELYGKQMAVGFSNIKRDGTRNLLKPYDTHALQAAAGITSTVDDMAKFVSWQFRLLKTGKTEILRASTLHDMQRVHWTDPDWKVTRGLGFQISQENGKTIIGHAGTCPGYKSALEMIPKDELAVIVMINAYIEPTKYTRGIHKLLAKVKAPAAEVSATPQPHLERFAGLYNRPVRGPEIFIAPWQGKLAMLTLPADDPSRIEVLRLVKDTLFRLVNDDGSDGEEFRFEANAKGEIVRAWTSSQTLERIR
jgi:CubicO group peptidase (beta-lactamase class C family)